jgi:hypothetical protein
MESEIKNQRTSKAMLYDEDVDNLDIKLVSKAETKTSRGMLSKGWYIIDGELCLVKGNSVDCNGAIGYEPYSEVIASRIAKKLELDAVEYNLYAAEHFKEIKVYGIGHVSVCKSYNYKSTAIIVQFSEYADSKSGKAVKNYWDWIHNNAGELDVKRVYDMLLLDSLIGNVDRHLNNWDVLIDKGVTGYAPVMDFGASLLAWESNADVKKTAELRDTQIGPDKCKPFGNNHTEQVERVLRAAKKIGVVPLIVEKKDIICSAVDAALTDCEQVLKSLSDYRGKAIVRYVALRAENLVKNIERYF